jgi:dolichol-phosphate mannosyltransferase
MNTKYSVVIPLKNEEGNVADLIKELSPIMERLEAPLKTSWELICIDDGSTDGTLPLLIQLAKQYPFLKILSFEQNYGQSSAFDAGFKHAKGQWIITLDGDRQNDPADIPKLLAIADQNDLVCGHRVNRQDLWHKRITSRLANFVRSRFCNDQISDTGCSLKIYRNSCLKNIKMFKGMHRFLPALFKIEGFRVAEIPVNHRERTKGVTKYNFFNRSFNTVADMLAVRWMWKRRIHYRIRDEI